MKLNNFKLISSLLLFSSYLVGVENSVVSEVERFEVLENLPKEKLTKKQFQEIATLLAKKDEKIRLVTYNMLFDLYDHHQDEVNRWPNRHPRIAELIQEMKPDIISTQELYPNQVKDISRLMNHEFTFFEGHKDEDGESYGIFYRTNRFDLLSSQMHDPISMVQLKDRNTGKVVFVFNTHMPLGRIEDREANAHKIVQMTEPYAKDSAVIFTGDLNTFPTRFSLSKLPFYDGDYIHRILSKGSLKDTHHLAHLGHFGPISSFTNHGEETKSFQGTGTPGVILDYIYASNKIDVIAHAVEAGTVEGHYPSDHLPVLIDFIIK